MKITAITKFKQGDLWAALKQAGWTQAELTRRCQCKKWKPMQSTIGRFVNMKERPSEMQAARIAEVFATVGVDINLMDIWPESFTGFKVTPVLEREADIPVEHLLPSAGSHPLLAASNKDTYEILNQAVAKLPVLARTALEQRFYKDMTLEDMGTQRNVCKGRASQCVLKGLALLRRDQSPVAKAWKNGDICDQESFEGLPELRIDLESAAARELGGSIDCDHDDTNELYSNTDNLVQYKEE